MTLDDLCEVPDESGLPWLDRTDLGRFSVPDVFEDEVRRWRRDGAVTLKSLLPDDLIDRYCDAWIAANNVGTGRCSPAWDETAYMRAEAVRDLCLYPPLMDVLNLLVGPEMGLHLNLLNWRSTTRDWHQDDYLNPVFINGHYAAVWFALDDIHPDSGPFQYVVGSHRWPVLRRSRVLDALGEDGSDPDWPWRSERLLSPLFEEKFAAEGIVPVTHLPRRGDVLIWHSRLVHRGSRPTDPGVERRAAIAHYSDVTHRVDMPNVATHRYPWSRYFVL